MEDEWSVAMDLASPSLSYLPGDRCQTRYCNQTCQHDHWRRGHKQMCKKIHRGGNAEQYNADKKYKEAVAVAVGATRRPRIGERGNI